MPKSPPKALPRRETSKFIYEIIGANVRKMRRNQNLSQDALARKIGLTRTSITNIEKGRQKFLVHKLCELATALSVPITNLLPASEPASIPIDIQIPPNLSSPERNWIKNLVKSQEDTDER